MSLWSHFAAREITERKILAPAASLTEGKALQRQISVELAEISFHSPRSHEVRRREGAKWLATRPISLFNSG